MVRPIPERLGAELKRKAVHLSVLAVIPVARWWGDGHEAWVVLAGLLLSLLAEVLRRGRGQLARRFHGVFGASIRPRERRGLLGVTPFFAVAFVMAQVAPWPAVEVTIAVVLVGDAAAAVVGRLANPSGLGRTWQGTVAYVVAGFLAGRALAAPLAGALVLSLVAAGAERMAGALHLDDNWVSPPLTLGVALALGLGAGG